MHDISRRNMLTGSAVLLGAALAPFAVTSCGNSSPAAKVAAAKTTKGVVRLRLETGEGADFEGVISALKTDLPNIQVQFTQVDPDTAGVQWHRIAIQNGLCDLLSNENPKFLYLDPLVKAGMLLPLDDYADLYGWQNAVIPEALKRSRRDGKLWTVPIYYELCGTAYRKSTLTKLKTEIPQDWDSFKSMLNAAKAAGMTPLTVGARGFSQVQMLHYQLWGSIGGTSGPGSIADVIFANGKFTDGPCVQAAEAIRELFTDGLLDPDVLSITQDDADERFIGGKAAFDVSGTWFYSEMQRTFKDDWDMFTAPGPGSKPVWCMGETESMVIPKNAKDPNAAAAFLNYTITGDGAKVLRQEGNVLSTKMFRSLAIPQVKHLPVVTDEPASILIYGWLPEASQDAYQQGLGSVATGSMTAESWAAAVQAAWESDIASGAVPPNRAQLA